MTLAACCLQQRPRYAWQCCVSCAFADHEARNPCGNCGSIRYSRCLKPTSVALLAMPNFPSLCCDPHGSILTICMKLSQLLQAPSAASAASTPSSSPPTSGLSSMMQQQPQQQQQPPAAQPQQQQSAAGASSNLSAFAKTAFQRDAGQRQGALGVPPSGLSNEVGRLLLPIPLPSLFPKCALHDRAAAAASPVSAEHLERGWLARVAAFGCPVHCVATCSCHTHCSIVHP